MTTALTPAHPAELAEVLRASPRVIAVGGGTKPRLSAVDGVELSTAKLNGMVEYEPSEFTFTALAGTPVRDIAAALAERGQYLPFDPMLVDAGATLGGTVAAGLSGPGRFRFGGLRDFILGVQFVDGAGRLLRLGGKVVKNAAGFDVPKFFVGSLGRFGVLTEITFKVFPLPASWLSLRLDPMDPAAAMDVLTAAATARWELDALDWLPDGASIAMRIGGPAEALTLLAEDILSRWPGQTLSEAEADDLWSELREFRWCEGQENILIKVPLAPSSALPFRQTVDRTRDARVHISAGGNVAYASFAPDVNIGKLDESLRELKLAALTLRGEAPLWLGVRARSEISGAVKSALDPENRFSPLED